MVQTVRAVDFAYVEWDYIPAPGEVYVIKNIETDNTYLKIGDGKHKLSDLPCVTTFILSEAYMEDTVRETCAQCEHLCVINRNKIYAVCDETGKVFELWHMDTRKSDACKRFIPKEKQDTKITLLKCPYCQKSMHLTAGNSVFSYWECYNCHKSFEDNIWTETFHDEKDFI